MIGGRQMISLVVMWAVGGGLRTSVKMDKSDIKRANKKTRD